MMPVNAFVRALSEEPLRQDPRAVDLSDGSLTRLELLGPTDVVEVAAALRVHLREIVSD